MQDVLNQTQLNQFIQEGFVGIPNAFSAALAAEARDMLWNDMDVDRHDRHTWTKPVIWLGMYTQPPFLQAANTEILHRAFDQLVGPDRWLPCRSMGSFPVRFPSPDDPGGTGWHVDASFPGHDPGNYFEWRINVQSKGRALLMLFLFSDVNENDAPTRLRKGSHLDVARTLQPAGEWGLSLMELAGKLDDMPEREIALATGKAGTVYLCHPFLAHAAQPHHGTEPRFLAQPPLFFRPEYTPGLTDPNPYPVEAAIRLALDA